MTNLADGDASLDFRITLDDTDARRRAQAFRAELEGIGATASSSAKQMDISFARLGATLAATFGTTAILGFARSVLTVRAEMQGLEASLSALTGSGERGRKMLEELTAFGASTPMELPGLARAAQTMLSFGVAGDRVVPIIKQMGDISGGSEEKLQSLALAFGQMSAAGRLMGQDLNQMIGAGFNPLLEISRTSGRSMADLKAAMEQGAVGIDEVMEAFRSATSEGGLFFHNLDAQSKTLKGALGELGDAYTAMLNSIGERSEDLLKEGIGTATYLIKHYEEIGKVLLSVAATWGTYKAAVLAAAAAQRIADWVKTTKHILDATTMLTRATQAQIIFNSAVSANPYAAAAALIVGVATALYAFVGAADKATEAQRALSEVDKATSDELAKQSASVKSLSAALKDNSLSLDARRAALAKLQQIVPDYNAQLTNEGRILRDNKAALDDYLKGLERQIKLKAVEDKLVDIEKRKLDQQGAVDKAKHNVVEARRKRSTTYNGGGGLGESIVAYKAEAGLVEAEAQLKQLEDAAKELSKMQADLLSYVDTPSKGNGRSLSDELEAHNKKLEAAQRRRSELLRGDKAAAEGKDYLEAIKSTEKEIKDEQEAIRTLRGDDKGRAKAVAQASNEAEQKRLARARAAIALRQQEEQSAEAERQLLLRQQEERLALMAEGWEREEAALKLSADKRAAAYRALERQLVQEERAAAEKRWALREAGAKSKAEPFDPTSIGVSQLGQSAQRQLAEQRRILQAQELAEQRDYLRKLLEGAESYEQQRLRIREDYNKRIESLYIHDDMGTRVTYRRGVTADNEAELKRSSDEALRALDLAFAQRSDAFRTWMERLADMSIDQLMSALKEARTQLALLQLQPVTSPGAKLAEAHSRVSQLEEAIRKAQTKLDAAPGQRSLKDWKTLGDALGQSTATFRELGEAVGGVAGEVLSAVGSISSTTTSAVSALLQLVQGSSSAMTASANAAAGAVKTVERASLALSVLSAALSLGQTIASLFSGDKSRDKEIKVLEGRIQSLQWQLDNAGTVRMERQMHSVEVLRQAIAEAEAGLGRANLGLGFANYFRRQEQLAGRAGKTIARYYESVSYSANKVIGAQRYAEARRQLEIMAQQQLALRQQVSAERGKKKSDGGRIEEWQRKIAELGEKQAEVINKLTEEVLGGDWAKLSSELGDSLSEAFARGESAAEAFNAKVGDILRAMVRRQLTAQLIEQPMLALFDKYKARFTAAQFDPSAITAMTGQLAADLKGLGERVVPAYTAAMRQVESQLTESLGAASVDRSASRRGIAAASQDSVDENNGLLRSIQGLASEMRSDLSAMRTTASEQLRHLASISEHTAHLGAMREELRSVSRSVADLETRGVKIRP